MSYRLVISEKPSVAMAYAKVLGATSRKDGYPEGKRPVIVIQNNTGNKFSPTVIVAAVTSKISKKPNQPTHVLIDKNPAFNRPSVVLLEQLFTIDKERINNFMGLTSDWEMAQIEKALKCSLALDQENLVKSDSQTA